MENAQLTQCINLWFGNDVADAGRRKRVIVDTGYVVNPHQPHISPRPNKGSLIRQITLFRNCKFMFISHNHVSAGILTTGWNIPSGTTSPPADVSTL